MKLVYIAGRYRGVTPAEVERNITAAEHVGWLVRERGHYPVIPHLNTRGFEQYESTQFTVSGQSDDGPVYEGGESDYYLVGTMTLMQRCDAVVMVPGWRQSSGAIAERREAERIGMTVYDHVDDLPLHDNFVRVI